VPTLHNTFSRRDACGRASNVEFRSSLSSSYTVAARLRRASCWEDLQPKGCDYQKKSDISIYKKEPS